MAKKLEPFDYRKHKPKDVGKGKPSTEILTGVGLPDGQEMIIPTVWWDEKGNPVLFENVEDAMSEALRYEKETGLQFPRYSTPEEATAFAIARSKAGGASKGLLARDISKEQQAKTAKTFVEALR